MKKILLLTSIMLLMLSCGKKTFTIKGVFDEQLEIPDNTEIGINIMCGDSSITYKGVVNNNLLTIKFDMPQEQLAVFDLGEMGSTVIAIESDKSGKSDVTVEVEADEDGYVTINKEGTLNNDFIQMYDNYIAQIYDVLDKNIPDSDKETAINAIIDKVYRTLKGEENSLTDINSLAGIYGFLNYYTEFGSEQIDTLLSMMNEKTLKDKNISNIYNTIQKQKQISAGSEYIDISATTPDGETLALSDLVGKTDYVLVDFWASWCGPCRASMPAVKAMYNRYQGKLQILGVSLDNNKEAWLNAIQSMELNWYHISDLQGWQAAAAKEYGVNAIPCTLVIDKKGVIVGRNMPIEEVEKLLQD